MRGSFVFGSASVAALFVVAACVGSDPVVVPTSTPDAASGASSSGSSSTSGGSSSGSSSSSGFIGRRDASSDSGPTISAACNDYCDTFATACSFGTSTNDTYPSKDVCLAICALMPELGLSADSVACRKQYLGATPDCPVAGPWAADNDSSKYCGLAQPCTALCRALKPECDKVGAGVNNCVDTCKGNILGGGNPARDCMQDKVLKMYGTNATDADLATFCDDFVHCN